MDDTLKRLCAIVNLLKATPGGLTVEEIAQTLQISKARVRTDLDLLSHELPLTADNARLWTETATSESQERWFLLSKRNALPVVGFTASEVLAVLAALQNVKTTRLKSIRSRLMEALFDCPERSRILLRQQRVFVKGVRQAFADNQVEQKVAALEEAILSEHVIRVAYRGPKEVVQCELQPLGLIYYWVWGFWYLAALQDGDLRVYRVERIESISTGEHFTYPEGFSLTEQFADAWGVECEGPLVNLAIKFYDEYRVIERVIRETEHRRNRQIQQINEGVIYHDRIRGLTEIRPWIRSFGSSAVVLEPSELRENMIQSAQWVYGKHL
jgi:predicted DNA-binding transcriptional regulator YafY